MGKELSMARVARLFFGSTNEYRAGLILAGVVLLIGVACQLLLDTAPNSRNDAIRELDRVYSLNAQPIICIPAKSPPSR